MKGNKERLKGDDKEKAPTNAPAIVQQEINGTQQILERLNIQLLISVIIYFVSCWIFLNNKICSFTGSEPLGEQMSYIFVHYILSITLLFCVVLTAIESFFMLNTENISTCLIRIFKLFLETWYSILGICLLIILLANFFSFEWLLGATVLFIFWGFKMYDIGFTIKTIGKTIVCLLLGFPIFISSMTSIIKDVQIETDKPFYSFSDKVLITVSARGYACEHKLIGLGDQYKDVKYYNEKGLIIMNATQIKNNKIAIATVSPASGTANFVLYPFCKMFGYETHFIEIDPYNYYAIRKYANFTPHSIYVKP